MALHHRIVPLAGATFLAVSLTGPALAQQSPEEEARARETRGVVLGLAALAVIGIALHELDDDDDDEEARLPAECLATWPTPRGEARLYDPDYLDERFEASSELPLDCAVTVRSRGGFTSGFAPGCLREEGWQARD